MDNMSVRERTLVACGRNHGRFKNGKEDFILVGSSDHLEPLSIEQYKEWELLKNSANIQQWKEKSSLRNNSKVFLQGIEYLVSTGLALDLDDYESFNTYFISRNGIGVGLSDGDKWMINIEEGMSIHLSKEHYLVWIAASGCTTIKQVILNIQHFISCEKAIAEKYFLSLVGLFLKTSLWIIEKYESPVLNELTSKKIVNLHYDDSSNLVPLGLAVGYLENIDKLNSGYYVCSRNDFHLLTDQQYLFWISLFNGEINVEKACSVFKMDKNNFSKSILNPLMKQGLVLPYRQVEDFNGTRFLKNGIALRQSGDNSFIFKKVINSKSISIPAVCFNVWSLIGIYSSYQSLVEALAENTKITLKEAKSVVSNSVIILMQKNLLNIEFVGG